MPQLPHAAHTTWQYGKKTDWFTKEQVLEYGRACEVEVRKECIPLRNELALYREREKTMGWSKE